MIRAILVDDEQPARDRLRMLLSAIPDVTIVGEAEDGEEAVGLIARLNPDLVLLDIQMPGRSGFEVAAALPAPRPKIIFCTAFDQYAIEAFEMHAIDYLLKPVSRARLVEAVGRVWQPLLEQRQWRSEIDGASEVQAGLLPSVVPRMNGLDLAAICRQVLGIGGDYYDFLSLGSGKLSIALGDVAGKGVAAALLMAGLHARLQSLAPIRGENVHELLAEVNRHMCSCRGGTKYATLFYGLYDEARRTLTYTNAGHNAPILFRAASSCDPRLQRLSAGGTVLGIFPQTDYPRETIQMASGDVLVLFTDGITEAANGRDEEFGEERLEGAVERNWRLTATEMRDRILAEVADFTGGADPRDDMTLVVAKVL